MILLVVSDSHGHGGRISDAVEYCGKRGKTPDALLFLGDGLRDLGRIEDTGIPIYAVRGNCDFSAVVGGEEVPYEKLLSFGEYKILMMHGHRFGVKGGYGAAAAYAANAGADILCFGHTHIPTEDYIAEGSDRLKGACVKPLYIFNPGSIGMPLCGESVFGVIEIEKSGVLFEHIRL